MSIVETPNLKSQNNDQHDIIDYIFYKDFVLSA